MLYSIIPPAIVVLSLAGIIIFLMKKAPVAARLQDGEKLPAEKAETGQQHFFVRIIAAIGGKLVQIFKAAVLKIKNSFSLWKKSRQLKKDGRIKDMKILQEEIKEESSFSLQEKKDIFFQRKSGRKIEIENNESEAPEKETVPEKEPEKAAEKKDLFEKILIERIAANPKDIEAYERLGEYYMEIENWNYAKECFKQVIKLNPLNRNVKTKMRQLEKTLGR